VKKNIPLFYRAFYTGILFWIMILTGKLNAQEITESCKIPQPEVYRNQFFSPLYEPDAFVVKEDTLLIASSKDQSLYFYIRRDSTWQLSEQIYLGETTAALGTSIDWQGDYIVVSDCKGTNSSIVYESKGIVFIFHRKKGKWSLVQKLTSPKKEADRFGSYVQLTDRFLIVGAPQKTNCTNTSGLNCETNSISRNYIYELKEGKWTYREPFPEKEPPVFFGQIQLTTENELLMPKDGKIFFFKLSENKWRLYDSLYMSDQIYPKDFNNQYLVAINAGDKKILTIFQRDINGKWKYLQTLSEENPRSMDTKYGYSVTIKNDEIAVGAPSEKVASGHQGKVYVYKKASNGFFIRNEQLKASDGIKGDLFGKKVFFSGNDVIVMAAYDHSRTLKATNTGIANSYPGDIYYFKR
jgi:hypothetical protein